MKERKKERKEGREREERGDFKYLKEERMVLTSSLCLFEPPKGIE
jgi:hypothetical protein